jgi:hypothetical protein
VGARFKKELDISAANYEREKNIIKNDFEE